MYARSCFLIVFAFGCVRQEPSLCHWVRCQIGIGDKPRNLAMGLKDMVAHLLPRRARERLSMHHDAGNDALMHVLLAEELVRRAGSGATESEARDA